MSTKTYIAFAQRGIVLDAAKRNAFYTTTVSDETRTARRNEARYTSRTNVCERCFVARSALGACNC